MYTPQSTELHSQRLFRSHPVARTTGDPKRVAACCQRSKYSWKLPDARTQSGFEFGEPLLAELPTRDTSHNKAIQQSFTSDVIHLSETVRRAPSRQKKRRVIYC